MTRVKLKGINRVPAILADGRKVHYHYHRATGIRLTGAPGSPEFIASWQAADASIRSGDRHAGVFLSYISAYRASSAFTDLAVATRKDYTKQIAKIEDAFGDMPLAALQDPRVRREFLDWRDKLAKSGARQADYAMTVLARILSWAVDGGELAINPVAKPGRKYSVDRSQVIWEPAHIAAFMAVASVEMQLAMIVALNTGQRQGDLLAASWTAFEGGRVKITQSKRGTVVDFAQTAELRRILAAAPRRAVQVLTTAAGLP